MGGSCRIRSATPPRLCCDVCPDRPRRHLMAGRMKGVARSSLWPSRPASRTGVSRGGRRFHASPCTRRPAPHCRVRQRGSLARPSHSLPDTDTAREMGPRGQRILPNESRVKLPETIWEVSPSHEIASKRSGKDHGPHGGAGMGTEGVGECGYEGGFPYHTSTPQAPDSGTH